MCTRSRSKNLSNEGIVNVLMESEDEGEDNFNDFSDDDDYVPDEIASDIEDEVTIEPNVEEDDSDEEEVDEYQTHQSVDNPSFFYGKDGTLWNKSEPGKYILLFC